MGTVFGTRKWVPEVFVRCSGTQKWVPKMGPIFGTHFGFEIVFRISPVEKSKTRRELPESDADMGSPIRQLRLALHPFPFVNFFAVLVTSESS